MKIYLLLFLLISQFSNIFSQENFEGEIDLNQIFWVRMMGYPESIPKWIKINPNVSGNKISSSIVYNLSMYHKNLGGEKGPALSGSLTVSSIVYRDASSNPKVSIILVNDPRFEGVSKAPIDHNIWQVYNTNANSSTPMGFNYLAGVSLPGSSGYMYNYFDLPGNGKEEIILYDDPQIKPVLNSGVGHNYQTWSKGTIIITNYKGVNPPDDLIDKYEHDPKYDKYKDPDYHDPEAERSNDTIEEPERPDRLTDANDNKDKLLAPFSEIEEVPGCLQLEPIEPLSWNFNEYLNEVKASFNDKFNLTFFDSSITEKSIPDYQITIPFLEEEHNIDISKNGKLNAGDYTDQIDSFFSIARSIVLIFVSLYAFSHVFRIIKK